LHKKYVERVEERGHVLVVTVAQHLTMEVLRLVDRDGLCHETGHRIDRQLGEAALDRILGQRDQHLMGVVERFVLLVVEVPARIVVPFQSEQVEPLILGLCVAL
jgi:hypothetical protein